VYTLLQHNPNLHYAWQYPALYTALDFMSALQQYNPQKSFRNAIMELADNYKNLLKEIIKKKKNKKTKSNSKLPIPLLSNLCAE